MKYIYEDSVAGLQTEEFEKLSDIIRHIEETTPEGDSEGLVFADDNPLLQYSNKDGVITWEAWS